MIISTTRPRRALGGFSLVEVMIGSTIGSFVLLGVLSTFLMLGRSGTNIVSYTTMDAQTRRALEDFSQDVRMASNLTWNSDSSITLTVPDNYGSNSNQVTYAWDTTAGSATYQRFYRSPATSTAAAGTKTSYISNVTRFVYLFYDRRDARIDTQASPPPTAAAIQAAAKRVQINRTITTANRTEVTATDTTLSASFVLRNKISN